MPTQKPNRRWFFDFWKSSAGRKANWRSTLNAGCWMNLLVTLMSVAYTVVAFFKSRDGRYTAYSGSCNTMKRTSIFLDILINIISTLLIATSNFTLQCLTAPTRKEVDKCHRNGQSLQIGFPSIKNWRHIPSFRRLLCVVLLISSLPMHLLINSVFLQTSFTNNYTAVVVDKRFLYGEVNNTPRKQSEQQSVSELDIRMLDKLQCTEMAYGNENLGRTLESGPWLFKKVSLAEQVSKMQHEAVEGKLKRLTAGDCQREFSSSRVKDYEGVLVVTDAPSDTCGTVFASQYATGESLGNGWTCNGNYQYHKTWGPSINESCEVQSSNGNWTLSFPLKNSTVLSSPFKVDYCLARATEAPCTITVIPQLLMGIPLGTSLTILCMIWILWIEEIEPLITTGDAIESFLNDLAPHDLNKYYDPTIKNPTQVHFKAKRRYLNRAASPTRQVMTSVLGALFWVCGVLTLLGVFKSQTNREKLPKMIDFGISPQNELTYIGWTSSIKPTAKILLGNAPQLILSIIYYAFNAFVTCLMAEHEYRDYGLEKKGLRVSRPTGDQRCTYWLSLPFKISIPMMAVSVLMHWLMSQSLSLMSIKTWVPDEKQLDEKVIMDGLSWSPVALIGLLTTGGVFILFPHLLGFWKSKSVMPITRGDSKKIMQSCRYSSERDGAGKVVYGVVDGDDLVGFTSGKATELQEGLTYRLNDCSPLDGQC